MKELKEYTDSDGYTFYYYDINDLVGEILCSSCRLYFKCAMRGEEDSCYEYNEKFKELEKEGIK